PERRAYVPEDEVPDGLETRDISGTELRRMLAEGADPPDWFTFPEVAKVLRAPARRRSQGLTVFFTGLPSAGKSTVANALHARLLEMGEPGVTLLDGDLIRKTLSAGLGFSKEDRATHIRRVGNAATEVTAQRGIALCAAIAPYDAVRKEVRSAVSAVGRFVLV